MKKYKGFAVYESVSVHLFKYPVIIRMSLSFIKNVIDSERMGRICFHEKYFSNPPNPYTL